jgi:3-oxoacyl-[acyl-carrier-protein] synthase III
MDTGFRIKIAGMGRYLPERIVTNDELEARCGLPAGWIEKNNGVCERRWISDETSSYMGAQAAREALDKAGMSLTDIDLILNASGTPEQVIPDTGALIQKQLGLGDSGIPSMSVHATCLSFVAALDMSASLIASGRYRNILIVSSDVGSCALNFDEPESATLMGDAAAAAVITATPSGEASCIQSALMRTYSDGAYYTTIAGGGSRLHPHNPKTRPEDNLFHMDGPNVLRMAHKYSREYLEALRPGLSEGLGTIDIVVPHQASKIGLLMLTRFGWPEPQIVRTIEWMGNCVAASIPATLYDALEGGRIQRGDEVLLVGTGAGLSLGGLILTY